MNSRESSTTARAYGVFGAAAILFSSAVSSLPDYSETENLRSSVTATEVVVAVSPLPDADRQQAFRTAIRSAESTEGVYGTALAEHLMGLGLALQREGRHVDALKVFKRGSHLARINDGLHTGSQIPYLEAEISSHRALGNFTNVDEAQARLYRIQIRSMGGSEALVEALIKQGEWQLEAYNLGVGDTEMSFSRLLNMWDLNRMAINNVIEREGHTSPQLLPPLYAMLQTQYLISGHKNRVKTNASDFRSETASRQDFRRFGAYIERGYELGRSILREIYDIQVLQNGEASPPAIHARIMQADWMLWYGERTPAMRMYALAAGELAQLEDAQIQTERLLGAPVALPDMDGVRPLLPEVGVSEGNILLEFGVNPNGSVIDLVRIRESDNEELLSGEVSEDHAQRLIRALHKTKFRPRFVQGEPILTENVVRAYVIN